MAAIRSKSGLFELLTSLGSSADWETGRLGG